MLVLLTGPELCTSVNKTILRKRFTTGFFKRRQLQNTIQFLHRWDNSGEVKIIHYEENALYKNLYL